MLSIYTHGKTRVGTRPRSKRIECAELHEHPFDRTVAERRLSPSREARLAERSGAAACAAEHCGAAGISGGISVGISGSDATADEPAKAFAAHGG